MFSNIVDFIFLSSVVLFIISRVNKNAFIYSLVLVAADLIAHFYIINYVDAFSTETIVAILNALYFVSTFSFTLLIILILTYIAKFSALASGVSGIFVTIFYAFAGIIFFDLLGKNISIFNVVLINKNIFYLILILWFIIDIYIISLGIDHNRRLYQLSSVLIIDSSLKGFVVASI